MACFPRLLSCRLLLLAAVCLISPTVALQAQVTFGNENPRESSAILVGLTTIDFSTDGTPGGIDTLFAPLEFTSNGINIAYSRSNALASFTYARKPAPLNELFDLRLIDVHLQVWAEMFFSEKAAEGNHRFFIPLTLLSNYRDVSPVGGVSVQTFQTTSFGAGAGVGYYGELAPKVQLELRATPELAVGYQSFGGTAGWTRLFDGNAELHIGPLGNNLGISFGYAFRATYWDVRRGRSSFGGLPNFESEPFDYREQRHTFSVGVHW